jgi:hypothetical protein
MTWHNPLLEKYLATLRAEAAELGLEIDRCNWPPYGWNLLDPRTGDVVKTGPLSWIEQYLHERSIHALKADAADTDDASTRSREDGLPPS